MDEVKLKSLIVRLFDVDAVKFGDFTLKSGIQSPVYFDLRVMISYPDIMVQVADLLWEKVSDLQFNSICGVPYTALPIATLMSAKNNIPMLIRRKEAKSYGTKKLIEGVYSQGNKCLIVEDVVSSGSSVLETVQSLSSVGIKVLHAVVLLNREQGGLEKLKSEGICLRSICTMTEVVSVLRDANKLSPEMSERVLNYIAQNKFNGTAQSPSTKIPSAKPFCERSKICLHPVTKRLFKIMDEKKTNLAFSADLTKSSQILQMVEKVGPHICVLKTHVDILEDFTEDFISKLKNLSEKYNFLIFEDRKFADIGNTVKQQFGGGLYRISDWAHIVNAHSVPGSGIIEGLRKIGGPKNCACLLLAEMSSAGNLASGDYTSATMKMAEENKDFVVGFISLSGLSNDPTVIHMTPGVQLKPGNDALGQQYLTPEEVITKRGSDIIIVGRGIYEASDPALSAEEFKIAGFEAYSQRL